MKTFPFALVAVFVVTSLPALAGSPKAAAPAQAPQCSGQQKDSAECHHGLVPSALPAHDDKGAVILRGEKLQGAPAVALDELLRAPASHAGKTVRLEGRVRKVCERSGCWMELAASDKGPGVRVTFKDYGFFVPLDSAGKRARVEGVVQVAALSEERARHYESEGAIVPRGKDGKPEEVQLVATGVELFR